MDSLQFAVWVVLFLEAKVSLNNLALNVVGGSLRQIAFGSLGTTVGIVMCYPTCSLRAMDYAWNAGTSKLIEGSEAIKRRFKSNFDHDVRFEFLE